MMMAALSGMSNVAMLAIVNGAAERAAGGIAHPALLLLYLIAFALYVVTQQYARTRAIVTLMAAAERLRLRLIDQLRNSELRFTEEACAAGEHRPLAPDGGTFMSSAMILVSASQSLLLVAVASLYLVALAPVSLLVLSVVYAALVPSAIKTWRRTRAEHQASERAEGELLGHWDALVHCLEEHRLDPGPGDAAAAAIHTQLQRSYQRRAASAMAEVRGMVQRRVLSYSAPFAVVLAGSLAASAGSDSDAVLTVAVTVLLAVAPLAIVSDVLPVVARVDAELSALYALEERLDACAAEEASATTRPPLADFSVIDLVGVAFSYRDHAGEEGFSVGPLDLRLCRGERLAIVGASASGKTTLVNLLCGLYPPVQGTIYVDGVRLTGEQRAGYRELFAGVFDDDWEGRRLSASAAGDPSTVAGMLEELGLADRLGDTYDDSRTGRLSPSERRRLALVIATLKEAPICVLDDIGAGQDPAFRRRLYSSILPQLSARGRTLVMVSSDEDSVHAADRVLRLRHGAIA